MTSSPAASSDKTNVNEICLVPRRFLSNFEAMEAFSDKQTLMSSIKQLEPTFSFGESALSTAESFRLTTDALYQDDSDIVAPHASQRSVMPGEQAFRDASFIITQDPRAISQVKHIS